MNTLAGRFAAVALGTLVASVGVVVAARVHPIEPITGWLTPDSFTPFTSCSIEDPIEAEAGARDERARAEVATLGDHPWAGVYRTAGTWPTTFVLAPQAGFTLHHDSRCGNCAGFDALGCVAAASENTLQLEAELSHPCGTTREYLDQCLYLVRWGKLLFAIAPQRMERFCADVTDGQSFPDEPVRVLGDTPFDFDAPKRPEARPVVPREWEHLLPATPIEARVSTLVELRPRETNTDKSIYYDAVFELDRGSDNGLAVGMRVFVDPSPNSGQRSGRIDEVEHDRACFTLPVSDEDRAWAEALVGKSTSTRHPPASTPNR
jgi:hypothetical protein